MKNSRYFKDNANRILIVLSSLTFLILLSLHCNFGNQKKTVGKKQNSTPAKIESEKKPEIVVPEKYIPEEKLVQLEDPTEEISQAYDYRPIKEIFRDDERKVYKVRISADNKYATIMTLFQISRISLDTLKEDKVIDHRRIVDGGFTGMEVSNDGKWILGGSSWETRAHLYDWGGKAIKAFQCKEKNSYVEDVSFSPDNQSILLTCHQFGISRKVTMLYDFEGNLIKKQQNPHLYSEFAPDGLHYFSYEGKEISIWDLEGKEISKLNLGLEIVSLSFVKNQDLALIGNSSEWLVVKFGEKEFIKSSKIKTDTVYFPIENYHLNPEFKSFQKILSNGKLILSGGKLGAYLWTVNGKQIRFFEGHARNVSAVTVSEDESFMVTASPDKTIIWKK